MTATTSRRPPGSAPLPAKRNWLADISRTVKKRPNAVILYGVPGIGKSSFAAQIPGVVFMVDSGELGIETLKESGLVDQTTPVLPAVETWYEALDVLEALRTGEHDHKALAIDSLGGFERLCHEEVCRRDFHGKWGNDGFGSFKTGYEASLGDWKSFLVAIDRLRDERNMSVLLLGHAKVEEFKNPVGPNFDKYSADVHKKTWGITQKWADMVLFSNFEVVFDNSDQHKQKAKAKGGKMRVLYTENEAAFDAKNRHNLPIEIDMGTTAAEAYDKFKAAIIEGRKQATTGKVNE